MEIRINKSRKWTVAMMIRSSRRASTPNKLQKINLYAGLGLCHRIPRPRQAVSSSQKAPTKLRTKMRRS